MAKQPGQGRVRRRERKNIISGVAHVNSTFNNTMITIQHNNTLILYQLTFYTILSR